MNTPISHGSVYHLPFTKLLGVTISHDLSWNKHVENIVKKAGKRLYMLYQLKRAGISNCLPQRCQTCTGICVSCVAHEITTLPACQTTSKRYKKEHLDVFSEVQVMLKY